MVDDNASAQASGHLLDEVRQLRRCVRDLVALSALPAAWSAGGARDIAENLADVLLRTLHLDLVYIRLTGSPGGAALEVVQIEGRRDSASWAREIGGRLEPWLCLERSDRPLSIPCPAGGGTLRAVVVPIGIAGDCGFVVAGAQRAEFPVQADRLLLGVAANQAAILVQRKRLEDELQKRVEQLAEADRRKDEFLATLAHELRNPLAPLRNSLQVVRMSGANERILGMMERQLHHLVHLVDDLLEVSRITRGKIELRRERVELSAVLQNAIDTSHPLIESSRHELAVHLPPEPLFLDADPVRLAQVVANLLNNAAKYTDPGGRITLTAGREGDEAVIGVRDTGIGIPPEMLPRIFEMFAQADRSRGRSHGGLGIGLALVRNLVQMHGGTLQAASSGPGQGSEFTVRLPLTPESRTAHGEAVGERARASGPAARRILVVDDNQDAADSLGMLLGILGNEVQVVHDGPSAIAAMGIHQPSVVLLDIGMPGMDGYEVARQIRARPELEKATLIALTGWGQEEDRRLSREAGFDHHLTKPVDLQALQTLLAGSEPTRGRT